MTPTVLVVDDSRPMREFIRKTLGPAVLVVGGCEDGAEALNAYSRLLPDWVLMDVEMKEVDGILATKTFAAIYPNARIIIVTGHDDVELHQAAFEAGAARYVIKEDLLSIVDILTTESRRQAEFRLRRLSIPENTARQRDVLSNKKGTR